MPKMALATAVEPRLAAATDCRATSADSLAERETSVIWSAMRTTVLLTSWISRDCCCEARSKSLEMLCACSEARVTCSAVAVTRPTSTRNSSTV